jgi:hypothetical protein
MFFQLVYTAATFGPVAFLFRHRQITAGFVVAIFTIAAFNGASYYIEIFSSRYQLKFNKKDTQKVAAAAAEVAIEVVRRRRQSEQGLNGQNGSVSSGLDSMQTVGRAAYVAPIVFSAEVVRLQTQLESVDVEDDLYGLYSEQLEERMAKEQAAYIESQALSPASIAEGGSDMGDDGKDAGDEPIDAAASTAAGAGADALGNDVAHDTDNDTGHIRGDDDDWVLCTHHFSTLCVRRPLLRTLLYVHLLCLLT